MQSGNIILQNLLDVLFPPSCVSCQRTGHILCPSCLTNIHPLHPPFCQHCGSTQKTVNTCAYCATRRLRLTGLRIVSIYQDPLKSLIHAFKYDGQTRLSIPLGNILAQGYQRYALKLDVIVPVPLHQQRQRERGYNQAELLARTCARLVKLPSIPSALLRTRSTPIQAQLSQKERQQNVYQAFTCQHYERIRHKRILLIDDVCTTGATLEACATALFQAGAQQVWGLVLARPL